MTTNKTKTERLIILTAFLLMAIPHESSAASPGLPFTEDFSSKNLIDQSNTTADVNTQEQAVRMAWARRKYGAFVNSPFVTISDDRDTTNVIAIGDIDNDGHLDVVVGNYGVNKVYFNTGLRQGPYADVAGVAISDDDDDTLAIALGDIDGDGDLDVVAGNDFAPSRIYLNGGPDNLFDSAKSIDLMVPEDDDIDETLSIVLGDMDNDGDLDIIEGRNATNLLYLNNGTVNPFDNVIGIAISKDDDKTLSLAVGDVDGDGDLDLVTGNHSKELNRLYLNNGTTNPFFNVAGVDISFDDDVQTASIILGDLDNDGDLDIVEGNINEPNRVYLNNGTNTPFHNVMGYTIKDSERDTVSLALGDVDGDGNLDLMVGKDEFPNRLFFNDGTASPFQSATGIKLTEDEDDVNTVSIALRDVNSDGKVDLVEGIWFGANRLYLNNGEENPFVNVDSTLISEVVWTLSNALGDMDGDGDLDLVAGTFNSPNRLYLNNGTNNPFANVKGRNITEDADATECIALADIDADGDLDVLVGNRDSPRRLYLNNGKEDPFKDVKGIDIGPGTPIALGDVDQDGDLDLVTHNGVYLHNGSSNPYTDFINITIATENSNSSSVVVGNLENIAGNQNSPRQHYLNRWTETPFQSVSGVNMVVGGIITLGDMDGDDDLDLVTLNNLYLNNGTSNPFTNTIEFSIAEDFIINTNAIVVGDIDGDADLDLVKGNGNFRGNPNRLYLNNGTDNPFQDVAGIEFSEDDDETLAIALGDVDGDGDLDVLAGNRGDDNGSPNRLYLNHGPDNQFQDMTGFTISDFDAPTYSIALGDVDSDGDLDVVDGTRWGNYLYLNDGTENRFQNVPKIILKEEDSETESIELGDLDGDGDLDLVVGVGGMFPKPNRLYLNNGTDQPFQNVEGMMITTDDDRTESIAIGDVNGDGHRDIVTGNSNGPNRLYMNNGTENPFRDINGINISSDHNVTYSVILGDVDGDGDNDLIAGNLGINRLYLNNGTDMPFNDVEGVNISDDDYDTFSIALGDVNGDGYLDVLAGNGGFSDDTPNRLYLNNGTENPFQDVDGVDIADDNDYTQAIALGDVDGDGDLDIVAANDGSGRLYLNNGTDNPFQGVSGVDISGLSNSEFIGLADMNNDGNLDVIVGKEGRNRIYLNNGTDDPFEDETEVDITDDNDGTRSIALGDVDGDGDLDVISGNRNGADRLYLHNGTPSMFENVSGVDISNDRNSFDSIAFGDVDGDGRLDVVVANEDDVNHLYLNNGTDDPFHNVIGLDVGNDQDNTRSVVLVDVDNDGDLDAVVGNNRAPNRLYLNNGTDNPFHNVVGQNITDDENDTNSILVGDVDNDTDIDVIAMNFNEPDRIYLNNGTENPFQNVSTVTVTDDDNRNTDAIMLTDVNSDGYLDIVTRNARIYLNNQSENPFQDVVGTDITDDGSRPTSVAVGDVNGDGHADIITGTENRNEQKQLYLNNRTENPFENVQPSNIADDEDYTLGLVLGDVDDDGDLDLIAVNDESANQIYLNNGTDVPFAGAVGIEIALLPDELESVKLADINGDGSLDIVTGQRGGPFYLYYLNSAGKDQRNSGFQTHLGTVLSASIDDRSEIILSATLTGETTKPSQTQIDFYMSNNGGQNWFLVKLDEPFIFPTTGSDLRWKAELHSLSPAVTPALTSISVTGNSAPTDILLSSTSIEENKPIATDIGMFEALDIDGGPHTYSLTDGAGSSDNAKFIIEENVLKANAVFDFETKQNYTIRVQATDEAGGEFDKQFTISISDANDPPTDIALSNNEVKENLPSGATVGVLSVTDIDAEDVHVFSLPDGEVNNNLFSIEETLLVTNATFDFEGSQNRFTVRVGVTDGGGAFWDKDFDVFVTDAIDSVEVKLQLSSPQFSFGKKLTVSADVSSDASGSLNAETIFKFSGPDDFNNELAIFSSEGGVASVEYAPPIAGKWDVIANWVGNSDFDPGQSESVMFTVEKSDTILELFFLGVPQILGQGRTIPGRLVLNNGNPGNLDLAGLAISVSIGQDAKNQTFTATTDAKGNFDLVVPEDFFDSEGAWDVTASFMGNTNLNFSELADEEEILVRQTHGYAILVQGSIDTGEGAEEHGNTLDFVRRSFESAGFGASIEDPDFNIILRNTPDPKRALREAIEIWAKAKMLAAPAPLYLVIINHGEFGKFHMHPDELTPMELDGMLDNLQRELAKAENRLAREQAIITILGMCFSGSFIDALSGNIPELPGNNRIVISSAAPDEFSIRGTDQDNERQGESFVYSLFRELNKGLSLTESFRNSRALVRRLSADRNLAIPINAVDPSFPGEKGQHPLLDDNGDAVGSSFVSDTSGDGVLASTIFLTQPTNAIPALRIDRVTPSVFLPPGQDIPIRLVFAEIDEEPEEIRRIWMEVKNVADDTGVDETSTMQHALDFFVEPMDFYPNGDVVGYEWPRDVDDPNPFGLFLAPGAYQVFFYAESTDERVEISDPKEVFVYRASGHHTPTDFSLTTPEDEATLDYNPTTLPTSGVFTWETSHSTGGLVTYIFRLWTDANRDELVFESRPLVPPHIFLRPETVTNGVTYWWDVVAVDEEGNFKNSSELFQFTVDKPNFPPNDVFGSLSDKETGALIMNGEVIIAGLDTVVPVRDGFYIAALGPGTYDLTSRSDGYLESKVSGVRVGSSPPVEINFTLTKIKPGQHALTITSNPTGIPVRGSVNEVTDVSTILDANTAVTLTVPEVFIGPEGHYKFVHWVVGGTDQEDGQTTVNFDIINDTDAAAVYRFAVGIILNSGWNLISVPVNLSDFSMDTLISNNPELTAVLDNLVWQWDKGKFRNETYLRPGYGYWMNSPVKTFIETNGERPSLSTDFDEKGWKLVGVKGTKVYQMNQDMDFKGHVWGWDNENQTYYPIHSDDLPLQLQNKLIPGHGYWLYLNSPGTIELGAE